MNIYGKFILVSAFCISTSCSFAQTADSGAVATKTVDTLVALAAGPHKGYRANHAKGVFLSGTFIPASEAKSLSTAPHFGTEVPVTVRFSTGTGVPALPDGSAHARPYGMAIRFSLPDGSFTDLVSISYNGFPVATPAEFLELLTAIKLAPTEKTKPTTLDNFLQSHPAALKFVQDPKPVPVSFANQHFYGVNSFIFENTKGEQKYFRYKIVPKDGSQYMAMSDVEKSPPNFLMEEIKSRVQKNTVEYTLQAQMPAKEDALLDGSKTWPENRSVINLGVIRLTSVPNSSAELDKQMFNPLALPKGIIASADPVLQFRPVVYAVSYGRRLY